MVDSYPRPGRSYEGNDGLTGDYRPGYEPSAPPYYAAPDYYHPSSSSSSQHPSPLDGQFQQQHYRPHPGHDDEFPRNPRNSFFGPPPADEPETLAGYLFRRMIRPVWRGSRTVLRIDLRRGLRYNGPVVGSDRGRSGAPSGASASRGGREYCDEEEAHGSRGWLNGVQGGGARLKLMQNGRTAGISWMYVYITSSQIKTRQEAQPEQGIEVTVECNSDATMGLTGRPKPEQYLTGTGLPVSTRGLRYHFEACRQIWDAPQHLLGESKKHWDVNFGFGMNVELDKGQVHPKLRLKARHVALHLLPVPEIELRGKWPLGHTRLAVNAKYRIPLSTTFEEIWTSSGARLMISFFNPLNTGLHLTPGGLEFDEHLIKLGEHTKLRLAASVDFPRKFPLEEGEQPLRLRVHRLGLKSVIMPAVSEKERSQHRDGL